MRENETSGGIGDTIEALAEAVVMVSPSDLPALAGIHTKLDAVRLWAGVAEQPAVVQAMTALANQVESLVLGEIADPDTVLQPLTAAVTTLQRVVRDGHVATDADFALAPPAAEPADAAEPAEAADVAEAEAAPEEPAAAAAPAPPPAAPAPQPAAEPATPSEPVAVADISLVSEFVTEATEHLEAADVHLLDLETNPGEQEALNAVFRAFHTIKGVAGFLGFQDIGRLSHEAENILDRARKGELQLAGGLIDLCFETVDSLKRLVAAAREAASSGVMPEPDALIDGLLTRLHLAAHAAPGRKLGELLVDAGLVPKEVVETALTMQQEGSTTGRLGEELVRQGQVGAREVAQALRGQQADSGPRGVDAGRADDTIKVDAERLDRLVNTIGELVIAEAMLTQALRDSGASVSSQHLGQVGKICRELQEMGTALRMVPVKPTFQKMARIARDVAKRAGKQIEFRTAGEDTELDKSVIDLIGDPLVHMVRNAVDHGLEPAEARGTLGKPPTGTVELRAYHKGGSILIEIEDDGRGLDYEAILEKGIRRGLVPEGQRPPERDVYNLIFEPGFSTAAQVTDISGRGVGLDVVRRNITQLRGQIDIRSERGQGSVFTLRLPLTLAVIDGMLVRVGSERYVLPTLSIITSLRPEARLLSQVIGHGEVLQVQGASVPMLRLADVFNVHDAQRDATEALAVVVEDDRQRVCLLVDELLGQQQIVIKSLGDALREIPGVAGGAIMSDGRVGLILDVGGLIRLASESRGEPVREAAGAAAVAAG